VACQAFYTILKEVVSFLVTIPFSAILTCILDCLYSLRFSNTRYDKITEEHRGSCAWIWSHPQYTDWSMPNASRLLYIQGKSGSGKSTVTKYFTRYLLERDPGARSAILAKFFYSYREGELQKSHYNMLQTILHDILQQDETFFYHKFQFEYRKFCQQGHGLMKWDYETLKRVFRSLADHSQRKPIYLVIDTVDEPEECDPRVGIAGLHCCIWRPGKAMS